MLSLSHRSAIARTILATKKAYFVSIVAVGATWAWANSYQYAPFAFGGVLLATGSAAGAFGNNFLHNPGQGQLSSPMRLTTKQRVAKASICLICIAFAFWAMGKGGILGEKEGILGEWGPPSAIGVAVLTWFSFQDLARIWQMFQAKRKRQQAENVSPY